MEFVHASFGGIWSIDAEQMVTIQKDVCIKLTYCLIC